MLNCGLVHMRVVAPREGWPNDRAIAAAAGATSVLEAARVFDTLAEAIADLTRVYATTARPRDMRKPVFTARSGAADIVGTIARGRKVGIVYGRERTGLENDDISRADAIIEVPLNPEFPSLNLAQAVLLTAYEWRVAALGEGEPVRTGGPDSPPASAGEMASLFEHLEGELDRRWVLLSAREGAAHGPEPAQPAAARRALGPGGPHAARRGQGALRQQGQAALGKARKARKARKTRGFQDVPAAPAAAGQRRLTLPVASL